MLQCFDLFDRAVLICCISFHFERPVRAVLDRSLSWSVGRPENRWHYPWRPIAPRLAFDWLVLGSSACTIEFFCFGFLFGFLPKLGFLFGLVENGVPDLVYFISAKSQSAAVLLLRGNIFTHFSTFVPFKLKLFFTEIVQLKKPCKKF
jgi:hypothetical protein